MGYIARLKRGTNYINLSGTNYRLGQDFVPPTVAEVPEFSQGTSANVYGGGSLVGRTAANGSLSFSLHIFGDSTDQIKQLADNLARFLRGAGDDSNPTYFWWNPDNDTDYEPLWGQSWRALEVVWGQIDYSTLYSSMGASTGRALPNCFVTLMCKPFAKGRRQRVATAYGGIMQDTIGRADGTSRGIMLPKATTNKSTNPVFGHGTPLNGWTAGAGLVAAANTDPAFVLFDKNSAKVTRIGAANLQFYQTLNVGNTNPHTFSVYAKKPDGSAITSSDIQLYYNVVIATTYTAVGDGWYRLTAAADGIASNTTSGVHMAGAARTVYIDGYQVEERTYASAICYGDLIGHAWTGTAHASTSTRAVNSYYRVPKADILDVAEGTIEMVYTPSVANTFSGDIRLFQNGATSLRAVFQASDDTFIFHDNTNAAQSAAKTWSAGDDLILHFTWHAANGLVVYLNGASIATNATYTPPTLGDYLYIGSTATPDEELIGTLQHFRTYARAMTSTEVVARYTNLAAQLAGDQVIGALPYEWTKDGDSVVDNCDDSTRDNYAVIAGIPGSVEAQTEYFLTSRPTYFAHTTQEYTGFAYPTSPQYYYELSGTADANSSGGEYHDYSTTYGSAVFQPTRREYFNGRIHFFMRARFVSADTNIRPIIVYTSTPVYDTVGVKGTSFTKATDTTLNMYYAGELSFTNRRTNIKSFYIGLDQSGGRIYLDYLMAIPGKICKLEDTGFSYYYLFEKSLESSSSGALGSYDGTTSKLYGDDMNLEAGKYNLLFAFSGGETSESDITYTVTFSSVYITPRWQLL